MTTPVRRSSPILLTSLIEAADRVDSTTGVQMAYVKQWAPRSSPPLDAAASRAARRRRPRGARRRARRSRATLGAFDLAYLDPPYNQHRYFTNYHVWETLVAWDAPEHYGVACKRVDARDDTTKSVFNREAADARRAARSRDRDVRRRVLVLSYNDESWVDARRAARHVRGARCTSRCSASTRARYVGAQIGIHNPQGERVGYRVARAQPGVRA